MIFTQEQRKDAYKRLPPDVQAIIMSNDTTDSISQSLQTAGLSEEQSDIANSEILSALIGLQTLDTAIKNIAVATQKPENSLSQLKSDLQENTFKKIEALGIKESDFVEASQESIAGEKTSLPGPTSNILPETLPGQIAHNVARLESMLIAKPVNTVPKTSGTRPNLQFPQSGYAKGKDPYREPLE